MSIASNYVLWRHLQELNITCLTIYLIVKPFCLGIVWQWRVGNCSPREIWFYTSIDLVYMHRRICLSQVPFGSNRWLIILPHVHSVCIIRLYTGPAVRARLLAPCNHIFKWIKNLVANILSRICTYKTNIFLWIKIILKCIEHVYF